MVKRISLNQLRQTLLQDPQYILIDVRTFQEYKTGHIPGARSVPLHEISRNAGNLPQDKEIVVYCQNAPCSMSMKAALELKKLGFQNITKLEGGYDEWNISGFPIESVHKHLPISRAVSYRSIDSPKLDAIRDLHDHSRKEFIPSSNVTEFLEARSPIHEFEYTHINRKDSKLSL
jgi:rhodanese-related sulfurtransferase